MREPINYQLSASIETILAYDMSLLRVKGTLRGAYPFNKDRCKDDRCLLLAGLSR